MEVVEFITKYWYLFGALIVILVLIILNELNAGKAAKYGISVMSALQSSNDGTAVLIDLRSYDEFKNGHLPTAQNIPLADALEKLKDLSRYGDKKIILYCATDLRSSQLCNQLHKINRETPVYSLRGGLQAWQQENLPLSKSKK